MVTGEYGVLVDQVDFYCALGVHGDFAGTMYYQTLLFGKEVYDCNAERNTQSYFPSTGVQHSGVGIDIA